MIPKLKVKVEAFIGTITQQLKDAGFIPLGIGSYAETWMYKGTVYKFISKVDSKAHVAFYQYCRKHPSKYLPKFQSMGEGSLPMLEGNNPKFLERWICLKMERLVPLSRQEQWLVRVSMKKIHYFKDYPFSEPPFEPVINALGAALVERLLEEPLTPFEKVLKEVGDEGKRLGFTPDMDGVDNIMQRPDGTFVILDPWGGW